MLVKILEYGLLLYMQTKTQFLKNSINSGYIKHLYIQIKS
jgi:hypothetical protein